MASQAHHPTLHLRLHPGHKFRRSCSPVLAGPGRNANARIMWRIDQLLRALRRAGRRSVAMIDLACGDGSRLVRAAKLARRLGFVAIEARGFDKSAVKVAAAAQAATAVRDPAIGLTFEVADENAPAEARRGGRAGHIARRR